MLLTKKADLIVSDEIKIIFGHLRYAAYKLWNVANYEKRNYKELGFEKLPDWYDQKKRLKDNFFYKNLPSQTAQDVLQELQEAWKSFFKLKETGGIENPRPPRFKHDGIDITFLDKAIKQVNGQIRLSIPKQLKEYLKTNGINTNYIFLKTERFSDIKIRQLRVSLLKNGKIRLSAVYEAEDVDLLPDNKRYLSIDLGIRNNMSCFDSNGNSFILNGILTQDHYFNKKIAHYQSISDSQQDCKYPKKAKRVKALYRKKKARIDDIIHKQTRYVTDYCIKNNINTVVMGDISGIRENADLGRNNQQLHVFPFDQIYEKLSYKLKRNGINFIKQKESYSSQCSPLSEKVSKEYAKKSNRKFRGLYKDQGKIFNADCVGAYNILRLYLQSKKGETISPLGLNDPIKVTM